MKKLILLILALVLLGGGYLAYDYSTSSNPIIEHFKEEVESKVFDSVKKQVGSVQPAGPDAWRAYCESKGGEVRTEERDGEELMSCFINDGKDGIFCQAKLFYELKCGFGEPVAELGKTVLHLNTDPDSNIHAVMVSENREGMTFVTKDINGEKGPDRIVMRGNDGSVAEVLYGDNMLPSEIHHEGTMVKFTNYSENLVDLVVTRTDGSKENYVRPFDFGSVQVGGLNWLIPSALAIVDENGVTLETVGDMVSEVLWEALPSEVKAVHFAVNKGAELVCSQIDGDCPLYEIPDVGTTISTIGCGIGLGSILFTGGASSPFAYMGCAALGTRIATANSEIGPCTGDILNCGTDTIIDFIQKEGFDYLPGVLSEGFKVHGSIINSVNFTPVQIGTLNATTSGNQEVRGTWNEGGSFEHYFQHAGSYEVTAVAEGYLDKTFKIVISSSKAQIIDGDRIEEYSVGGQDYLDMEFDFAMQPDAFIVGEVVDSKEAEPIVGAKVVLEIDGQQVGSDISYDDGTFTISPKWVPNPFQKITMQVTADDYLSASFTSDFKYELKPDSDLYLTSFPEVIKLELLEGADHSGDYFSAFSHSNSFSVTEQGAQVDTDQESVGSVGLTVDGDRATCTFLSTTTFTTVLNGTQTASGKVHTTSNSCSGSIDSDGNFSVSANVTGELSVPNQPTVSIDSTVLITGKVDGDHFSGTISIPNAEPIPFGDR